MSVKELRAGVFTLGRLFREVDPKSARGFFFFNQRERDKFSLGNFLLQYFMP